jgi:hypothetical protein
LENVLQSGEPHKMTVTELARHLAIGFATSQMGVNGHFAGSKTRSLMPETGSFTPERIGRPAKSFEPAAPGPGRSPSFPAYKKNGGDMAIMRGLRLIPSEDRRRVEVYVELTGGSELAAAYDLPAIPD